MSNGQKTAFGKLYYYFFGVTLGAISCGIAIFLVTWVVDPYHYFGKGDITLKSQIHGRARFHKSRQIKKVKPSIILLGSSRVYTGLDPNNSILQKRGKAYNFGVPAARIAEIAAFLEHANNVNKLDAAIVGLDFFAFDPSEASMAGMPWDSLYRDNYRPGITVAFKDFVKSTLSIKSLVDSIKPFVAKEKLWDFYQSNGLLVQTVLDEKINHVGGYYNSFNRFLISGVPTGTNRQLFSDYIRGPINQSGPFDELTQIIQYAISHNIKLDLFISPLHAAKLEYMIQVGLQETHDLWRKRLIEIVTKQTEGSQNVSLWDFSGYNHINTEEIPPPGDSEKRMTYFLDASHYKTPTGDLILSRILSKPENQTVSISNYGDFLTNGQAFTEQLAKEQHMRSAFLKNQTKDFSIYERLMKAKGINKLSIEIGPQG